MNTMPKPIALAFALVTAPVLGEQELLASRANNEFGLDLYRELAGESGNLCISPLSIMTAFAMTSNGADGRTLAEMQKVLRFPQDLSHLNASVLNLVSDFEKRAVQSIPRRRPGPGREASLELSIANTLFGQEGYPFRRDYLKTLADSYRAPLQLMDFKRNPDGERLVINKWVSTRTKGKIEDLLPQGSLNSLTRLVLVNALYFKAGWRHPFPKSATKPAPFHLSPGKSIQAPTMRTSQQFGYARGDSYTAITLPYSQSFVMLALVPDEIDGLPALEKKLTATQLGQYARLQSRKVQLHLPKFRIAGNALSLSGPFKNLGMKLAFNPKEADFGRMCSDPAGLFIDDAYHKTFIGVDEKGTEAAAATAVVMSLRSAVPRPEQPVEVRLDRPFLYAIMDSRTGTALFLGRMVDPR